MSEPLESAQVDPEEVEDAPHESMSARAARLDRTTAKVITPPNRRRIRRGSQAEGK